MSNIIPTGINFYDNKNFDKKIFFFKDDDLKCCIYSETCSFHCICFFQRATFALTLLMQNGEITDNHEFVN